MLEILTAEKTWYILSNKSYKYSLKVYKSLGPRTEVMVYIHLSVLFNKHLEEYGASLAMFDTALFKKMNILFEWIFLILKKWIFFLMIILDLKKNEKFVWINILDFKKMNILFE